MGLGERDPRCDRARRGRDGRGPVWVLRHTERELEEALRRLARHGRPGELPVAIERTTGLVVARLLTAGHPVVPVHPNAFHAAVHGGERPRRSRIRATATSSPTTCAPTGTGCAVSGPSTQGPESAGPL